MASLYSCGGAMLMVALLQQCWNKLAAT